MGPFFFLLCLALRVLVTADLLVLPLSLLHELLENGVVVLSDGLGRHLNDAVTIGLLNVGGDSLNTGFQHLNTKVLVQTLAGQNIQGRSHQLDLDLVVGGVLDLRGAQCFFDSVDSFVAEAGDLDVRTDLGGVGGELLADVLLQLLLDSFAGEFGLVPDFRVTANES